MSKPEEKKPEETKVTIPANLWGQDSKSLNVPPPVFLPASEVADLKIGLKILLWGATDTRKTGCALSFPPPIYIVDTQLGAPPIMKFYQGKDIRWCDAAYLDPLSDMTDPIVVLQRLEQTITLLKDVQEGTIVIDSGTDVWDWMQDWIDTVGQKSKDRVLQFEWAKVKKRWNHLILRIMKKPVHFVMTALPQELYEKSSEGKPIASGKFVPRFQRDTSAIFDLIVHCMRKETINEKTHQRDVVYRAEVTKCRFKKGWRQSFIDVSYDQIVAALEKELGVKVWEGKKP